MLAHRMRDDASAGSASATLASLGEAEAATVGAALLQSFHELLGSLVGPSLTERLLRSLWDRPLSDPPASDTTA